jgi:NAD-dependent SIR2 family protein deacetylase
MASASAPSASASASIRALGAALRRAKRVVVLCGAGTSTAAGIPDFRSPGTGLYDNLVRQRGTYAGLSH